MEKITITGVWRNDRTSKDGKPYVGLSVKTREYGDKYLSSFGAAWNQSLKVGDEIEVEVTKKPGVDKKTGATVEYLNFSKPDPTTELSKAVMRHEQEIGKLWAAVKSLTDSPAQIDEPPIDYGQEYPPEG